jgi:hypothetical protein
MAVASCHFLGNAKRHFFFSRKVGALLEVGQILKLVVRIALPPCQGSVGGESVIAMVDLRGADKQQLFQLGRNRSSLHDRPKVSNHRSKNFRPVGDRSKHVGNISPDMHEVVVYGAYFGIYC